jgi:hypothetical protein
LLTRFACSRFKKISLSYLQEPRKVAIKYVKPHQRRHSHSAESKPFCNIISELKLECEALLVLPARHPNVVGLEGVIAQFPAQDGAQQVIKDFAEEVAKTRCKLPGSVNLFYIMVPET